MRNIPKTNKTMPIPKSAKTVVLNLPETLAGVLQREAKARKKTMPEIVTEWLQNEADEREADKLLTRIKAGKEKTATWSQARKRLMEAP